MNKKLLYVEMAWSYWLAAVLRNKHTAPLASTCQCAGFVCCTETVTATRPSCLKNGFHAFGKLSGLIWHEVFCCSKLCGHENLTDYCWDIEWDDDNDFLNSASWRHWKPHPLHSRRTRKHPDFLHSEHCIAALIWTLHSCHPFSLRGTEKVQLEAWKVR